MAKWIARSRLDHIADLEKKATPAPWFRGIAEGDQLCLHTVQSDDARFIAAARNTGPLLIKLAKQVAAAHKRGVSIPPGIVRTLKKLLVDQEPGWREAVSS